MVARAFAQGDHRARRLDQLTRRVRGAGLGHEGRVAVAPAPGIMPTTASLVRPAWPVATGKPTSRSWTLKHWPVKPSFTGWRRSPGKRRRASVDDTGDRHAGGAGQAGGKAEEHGKNPLGEMRKS